MQFYSALVVVIAVVTITVIEGHFMSRMALKVRGRQREGSSHRAWERRPRNNRDYSLQVAQWNREKMAERNRRIQSVLFEDNAKGANVLCSEITRKKMFLKDSSRLKICLGEVLQSPWGEET